MRPQPYTKEYKQLSKAGSQRDGPPQGGAQQSVVWCPSINTENTPTRNFIQTEQVMYAYMK